MRWNRVLTVVLFFAVAIVGLILLRRWFPPAQPAQPHSVTASAGQTNAGTYADPASCAVCHDQIARTYSLTGMARSFSRLPAAAGPVADFSKGNRFQHAASGREYTMFERDGRFFQRRHDVGFDGKESNVVEMEANYVVGSGNHARTFVHRRADGRLLQLPVTWYAGRGGFWAMSPGYDRPAHADFRRLIVEDCMSCHNGYPRAGVQDDGNGPKFFEPLPQGIDCQRCHGPGQNHVDAIKRGDVEAGIRAIVNPAKLDRERQLETCMQCHLETTSSPLPFQIRRYEHAPFSYVPGTPLGDHFMHFDHAPGTGRDDKFEIASGAYRLRKSACFLQSTMTCNTCHDPHDIPRGAKAVQHYVSVCQGCHKEVHPSGVPATAGVGAGASCLDCHMPKRRAEDAVHVVMTDHYIQRRRAAENLTAPRKEGEGFEHGTYRGPVELYYPEKLVQTPENELYVALAQVQQGSNLSAGIARLEQALQKFRPERPDFYFELARAYSKRSDFEAVIRWCKEALRRDANFAPALKELGAAALELGRLNEAAQALEKAVALRPRDTDALADLGNVYVQQDKADAAQRVLEQALTLDPTMPRGNNTRGLAALRKGQTGIAEEHFREAIRHQPDLSEAQSNLGNLLASRKSYAEAAYHFEQALRATPASVQTRHNFAVALALSGAHTRAVAELQQVIRESPGLLQARLDLGDVFATMGRTGEAVREYEIAARETTDPEIRSAALTALGALRR